MGILERVAKLLSANINDLIDQADDPVKKARQLVREIDDEIIALRGRLRSVTSQAQRQRKALEQKQEQSASWQMRAEQAVDEGKDDLARTALRRKHDLAVECKTLEAAWWDSEEEEKILCAQMKQLEDLAQDSRRHKESLIAKRQREQLGSRFVPLASLDAPAHSVQCGFREMEIDDELQRLKESRGKK